MKWITDLFKSIWSSKLSILGSVLTTVSAIIIVIAYILSLIWGVQGAYTGLVAYLFFPAIFVIGLILIPIGVILARKKASREGIPVRPLKIDFSISAHRKRIFFILILTSINSVILSIAFYEGYQYTESVRFCGTVCHTVMRPEFTAYQRSPHARVACSECHIGSGASWYVKSKLSGIRQVIAVVLGTYHKPIPTPVAALRPARETCEECHWPQFFHGKKLVVKESLDDSCDVSNPYLTALEMNIGGLNPRTNIYEGIHWHVSNHNKVEYLSVDEKRRQIKAVRVFYRNGKVTEFVAPDLPRPKDKIKWRTMDCVDCHNRPTHIFDDPQEAIDSAILAGKISHKLPEIRYVALLALKGEYLSHEGANLKIRNYIKMFYEKKYPELLKIEGVQIVKAAQEIYKIYSRNVFPSMRVTFGTYPNNLGHKNSSGCFRCHDDEHVNSEGDAISQDCSLCHEIIVQDEKLKTLPQNILNLIKGDVQE